MALSVDGAGGSVYQSSAATSATITGFSTSNSGDVLVLIASGYSAGITITSITDDSGVTAAWQSRSNSSTSLIWYTTTSAPLSGATITINYSGSTNSQAAVIAISGADTASPFDSNGALPNIVSGFNTYDTVSTSNANDIIVNMYTTGGAGSTRTSGFTTLIDSGTTFCFLQYMIVSATQSGVSLSLSGGSGIFTGAADAIKQASAAAAVQEGKPPGTIFVPAGRGRGPSRGLSRTQAFPPPALASLSGSVTVQFQAAGTISAPVPVVQVGMSQGFLFHPGSGPTWDIKRRQAFPPSIPVITQALFGSARVSLQAKLAAPTGTTPLTGSATILVSGRGSSSVKAALAGSTKIAVFARTVPPGVIALFAMAFVKLAARASLLGSTQLTAATSVAVKTSSAGTFSQKLFAFTKIAVMSVANIVPIAKLSATAAIKVMAKSGLSSVASLSAPVRIAVTARGTIIGKTAMAAAASINTSVRAALTAATPMQALSAVTSIMVFARAAITAFRPSVRSADAPAEIRSVDAPSQT